MIKRVILILVIFSVLITPVYANEIQQVQYIEIPLSEQMQDFIYTISEYDINKHALILAIIKNESGFDVSAIGYNAWNNTRDWGLGQINDINYIFMRNNLGITSMYDLLDGETNVQAMNLLLEYHLENVDTLEQALLRYQVGEGAYSRLMRRGIYTTDTHQVVLGYYYEYLSLLE